MKKKFVATISAIFICATLLTYIGYAQEAPSYVKGELLVGLKPGERPDAIADLNAQSGAQVIDYFDSINVVHLRLAQGDVVDRAADRYSQHTDVAYAEPNYIYQAVVIPNDPQFNQQWGLNNTGQTNGKPDADIDAPEAWNIQSNANSIIVAVIDTGTDYTHPDLAVNIWRNPGEIPENGIDDDNNGFVDDIVGWDFFSNDNNPIDEDDHGTHTAGTIGAVGNNGIGVTGVAWNVQIMVLRFLGPSGSTANAIKCINYAKMMGAHLTSNSWGGGGFSQSLQNAIMTGPPIFVAAAGNSGLNTDIFPHYPSSYPLEKIISVAATDHNDRLASFSNFGKKTVDLGAPGVSILSTTRNNTYKSFSGTSMAAPHVAGVVALVMAEYPGISPVQVLNQVLSVDIKDNLLTKTSGRLNALKALQSNVAAAPTPVLSINPMTDLSGVPPTRISDVKVSTLGNSYPNPANPEVWIPYQLNVAADVTITIYNSQGHVVRTLNLGHRTAGIYHNKQVAAHWDGRDASGQNVASGLYFYMLRADDFSATRKLVIAR